MAERLHFLLSLSRRCARGVRDYPLSSTAPYQSVSVRVRMSSDMEEISPNRAGGIRAPVDEQTIYWSVSSQKTGILVKEHHG